MAEAQYNYSPYHYTYNNPILYNDPTGMIAEESNVISTWVVNRETNERFWVDDGYYFDFYVSDKDFSEIKKTGAIPKRLQWDWNKEFWKQVWAGVIESDGSATDEITKFLVTDDIDDIFNVRGENYLLGLAITIPLSKLKKLKKLAKWLRKNKGRKLPGTKKGNVLFKNREGILPKVDANGSKITYKEYDINPAPKAGQSRGAERIVTGSDGKIYYTEDHYKTFTEIKD